MDIERKLADFVCHLDVSDVPADAQRVTRLVLLAATGTAVAGKRAEVAGGVILILIGTTILIEHLNAAPV